MLIASPRHTPEDLRVWTSVSRVDRAWGLRLDRKIDRAVEALRAFAAAGPCYAGVSWGKDSVTLAHLVASQGLSVPLVWLRWEPMSNPDCKLVRDAFLSAWRVEYHEIVARYEWRERWVNVDDEHDRDGFRPARDRFGPRHVSGIRAEESRGRAIRCAVWGESSPNTCAPLARWTALDVFGYLARYELPIHPAYAMTMGGALDRLHLRVDCLGGDTGTGHGRREWEWTYYRDEMMALGESVSVFR